MRGVTVALPWRPAGCQWRTASQRRVADHWAGWDTLWLDDGTVPFSRARSVNLAEAADWDVLVIADADTLIDHAQVERAAEAAAEAPGMVLAYDRYRYLGKRMTRRIWDGYTGDWNPGVAFTLKGTVSSCLAVSRTTWDTVAGFDPRFVGWGSEDCAFERACRTLTAETRRIPGPVWHLWHPTDPTNDRSTPTLQANRALDRRYQAAELDPTAMAALIAERTGR